MIVRDLRTLSNSNLASSLQCSGNRSRHRCMKVSIWMPSISQFAVWVCKRVVPVHGMQSSCWTRAAAYMSASLSSLLAGVSAVSDKGGLLCWKCTRRGEFTFAVDGPYAIQHGANEFPFPILFLLYHLYYTLFDSPFVFVLMIGTGGFNAGKERFPNT